MICLLDTPYNSLPCFSSHILALLFSQHVNKLPCRMTELQGKKEPESNQIHCCLSHPNLSSRFTFFYFKKRIILGPLRSLQAMLPQSQTSMFKPPFPLILICWGWIHHWLVKSPDASVWPPLVDKMLSVIMSTVMKTCFWWLKTLAIKWDILYLSWVLINFYCNAKTVFTLSRWIYDLLCAHSPEKVASH